MAAIQRFPELKTAPPPAAEPDNSSLKREIARMEALVERRLAATQDAAPQQSAATPARNPRAEPAPAATAERAPDAAPAVAPDSVPDVARFMPQPPWHARHARTLLAAVVLVVAGVSYAGYRAWQIHLHASDRIGAAGSKGKQAAIPAPASEILIPETVPPPAPAVRMEPLAEPVGAVRRGGTPAVTHTRREPAPVAAAPVAAAPATAAPVKPSNCTDTIVALGLCTPERALRK